MKKIAITGANGFIGSLLVNKLLDSEWKATALVRHGSNIDLLPKKADVVYVDYNNTLELETKLQGYDIIIHNAALTKAPDWETFKSINVDFTARMVELANSLESVKQFIFISTQAVVGPTSSSPLTEEAAYNPVSMYGKSKAEAEKVVKSKCNKNYTILRPVSVYGPGEKDFLQYFQMIKFHFAVQIGKKPNRFNLIFADDLLDMLISCFNNPKAFNETFFLSNNEPIDLTEFIEGIEKALNTFTLPVIIPKMLLTPAAMFTEAWGKMTDSHPTFNREKAKEMGHKNWSVSNSKMREKLGIEAKTDLWEGLFKTIAWYKEKGWL